MQDITKLKEVSIVSYLASIGHRPTKESAGELQYYSPLRNESTPSFFVNPDKNVFNDFGGERGDIIRLVSALHGIDFQGACRALTEWTASYKPLPLSELEFPGTAPNPDRTTVSSDERSSGIRLIKDCELRHPGLIRYAANRGVPFLLAAKYCREVHYENANRKYFALGFANDIGGYELRNRFGRQDFKACISPKGISTVRTPGSTAISVFEGFFDFLAALVYYGVDIPRCSVLILNSTSNLKKAQATLTEYKKVYTFLDNDTAGRAATLQLQKWKFPVVDKSTIYRDYKDFSEMVSSASGSQEP